MMGRNLILSIALVLVRLLQFLLALNLLILLYFLFQQLFNEEPGFSDLSWSANINFDSSLKVDLTKRFTPFAFFYNFCQSFFSSLLYLLVSFQILQVLRSVRSFKAFIEDNAKRFRSISAMILGLFLINMIEFQSYLGEGKGLSEVSWSFEMPYLIFFISAYVLAEIFKEGKRLAEEQNLIV